MLCEGGGAPGKVREGAALLTSAGEGSSRPDGPSGEEGSCCCSVLDRMKKYCLELDDNVFILVLSR